MSGYQIPALSKFYHFIGSLFSGHTSVSVSDSCVCFLCVSLAFKSRRLLRALLPPLGLIGVVAALLVFGQPLGFVAILGILALIGMIAKNAVILITQIEDERRNGLSPQEAAISAAMNRFRPLLLTALSTVLGLLPIAPTLFWGPMAFAIMGGLLVATLLTLIFLPVRYVTFFGDRAAKA